jgi:release factor H-coupled RctB family protein
VSSARVATGDARRRGAPSPGDARSAAASLYLRQHDDALAWARANRELIAERLLACLDAGGERLLDACHNSVDRRVAGSETLWLHRKGAAPSTEGALVIPGSRGSFSYLVVPREASARSGWSVAHGAGRKWSRSDSRARLERLHSPSSLARTRLGSVVICEDRDLLYEEAPQVYKKIDVVIADMVAELLIDVVAVLRPLVTYKLRR